MNNCLQDKLSSFIFISFRFRFRLVAYPHFFHSQPDEWRHSYLHIVWLNYIESVWWPSAQHDFAMQCTGSESESASTGLVYKSTCSTSVLVSGTTFGSIVFWAVGLSLDNCEMMIIMTRLERQQGSPSYGDLLLNYCHIVKYNYVVWDGKWRKVNIQLNWFFANFRQTGNCLYNL